MLTISHVLIRYLNVFISDVSIKVICPFDIGLSVLLLLISSFLYVLGTRPLSEVWIANIFSQSVSCLFIINAACSMNRSVTCDEM